MTRNRALSDIGKDKFMEYIQEAKSGLIGPPPVDQLSKEPWSSEFPLSLEVENKTFSTRMELAKYLGRLFSSVDRGAVLANPGMWSWLALFWFDLYFAPEQAWLRLNRRFYRQPETSRDIFRHRNRIRRHDKSGPDCVN